uniref:Uncharacterized protein n=1 Tax=Anguilla anguilla TaxID=7936 RepID=A0A0E9XSY9_ANGAN
MHKHVKLRLEGGQCKGNEPQEAANEAANKSFYTGPHPFLLLLK